MMVSSPAAYASLGARRLCDDDPELYEMLEREQRRQSTTLAMIAAASVADPSVTACEGTVLGNITTEGYPGARFHAGASVADEIERLAIRRAKALFGASYANVQPHSGSTANQSVIFSLLKPGDVLLGMDLGAGGHLTHGSSASVTGRYFNSVSYGTDASGFIDYAEISRLAKMNKPRLIICGASAYPRQIDFVKFRAIADEVGAFLLADISHIAGLVVAGLHPSPVDVAHAVTTSTYKQLYGPRGGLILQGENADMLPPQMLQRAIFPFVQGTPQLQAIAAKSRALALAAEPEFRVLAQRVADGAKTLASSLADLGYDVLTGGTDTHMVLVDLSGKKLTGLAAERALESCGIIVNKNKIPGDPYGPTVTSGLRFGTNILAARGMQAEGIRRCAALVDSILSVVRPDTGLDPSVRRQARQVVADLCAEYPLPSEVAR
jgi:glycine hydroxymethyltransferase